MHAGRRQRARQHAGALQRPGHDAAGPTRVIDRVMEQVVAAGRRGLRRARHRRHQAQVPRAPERIDGAGRLPPRRSTPAGLMNPGKLDDRDVLEQVFTPSFNLLELEATHPPARPAGAAGPGRSPSASAAASASRIAACTTRPRGLFYHPRNKNLAIGSLIEALLYDAQRERTHALRAARTTWRRWPTTAPSATSASKPCPVDIDTGEVSRAGARDPGRLRATSSTALATRRHAGYLDSRSPDLQRALPHRRAAPGRRRASALAARWSPPAAAAPTRRPAPYPLSAAALARAGRPAPRPCATSLPACGARAGAGLRARGRGATARSSTSRAAARSGSTSRWSMAALHLLLAHGHAGGPAAALPVLRLPGPRQRPHRRARAHGAARTPSSSARSARCSRYLAFDACVVSCGTCREGLVAMGADQHLRRPGGRRGAVRDGAAGCGSRRRRRCSTTRPATTRSTARPREVLSATGGVGRGRAGRRTAAPRPARWRSRARTSPTPCFTASGTRSWQPSDGRRPATVLTNCPSCLQGLGRCASVGVRPRHLAVHLAERLDGPGWRERFRVLASRAQAIHF